MDRGYLWENLGEEIALEFSQYSNVFEIESLLKAGGVKVIERSDGMCVRCASSPALEKRFLCATCLANSTAHTSRGVRKVGKSKTTTESVRELRERRRGAGLCSECDTPRDPKSKNYCPRHREADRIRAAQKRELAMREKMPSERSGITQRFTMTTRNFNADGSLGEGTKEIKGYITASVYPDNRDDGTPHPLAGILGEVFVKIGRPGSTEALLDQWAVSFSRELQRGEDLETLCRKHMHTQFEPSGAVSGIKGVTRCSSPVDLVCAYLLKRFGKSENVVQP